MEKISIPENLFAIGAGQIRSLSAVVSMCGFFSVLHLSARFLFLGAICLQNMCRSFKTVVIPAIWKSWPFHVFVFYERPNPQQSVST